ncbi:MAG: hypothetical protein R2825_21895 [Saprospiraceae bacterium]
MLHSKNNTTGGSPGNGGGVHITGAGEMHLTGGVVSGNTASAEGGGLVERHWLYDHQ